MTSGSPQSEPHPQSIDALIERDRARLEQGMQRARILLAVVTFLLVARLALALAMAGRPEWRHAWLGALIIGLLALNWLSWRRHRDRGA